VFGAFVILAATATASPADLVAAAAASGRPPECRRVDKTGAPHTIWVSAHRPELRRYCHLLARAHARFSSAPEAAKKAAEQAAELLPRRAAPKVLQARLALAQGDPKTALARFDEARKLDPNAIEQPLAMHDHALARRQVSQWKQALAIYRVLAPRVALLPNRERRARVLLEAAHAAMATGSDSRHVEEALAYLRAAMRDPHQPLRHEVALSLVLTLDRAGRRAQADAVLADQRGLSSPTHPSYLAAEADQLLLRALAAERREPAAARRHYEAYLQAAPSGPFAATARARSQRLAAPTKARRRGRRR
jgi:tetratricopeptide (TPR) repeat protein